MSDAWRCAAHRGKPCDHDASKSLAFLLPVEAPDNIKRGSSDHCPSCDLLYGPVAEILELAGQTDGDMSQLALIHPNPSDALVDLFAVAQHERLALSSAIAERHRKEMSKQSRQRQRTR